MSTNLHIRDVPDEVHAVLKRRAAGRGKSLRSYTIEVLAEHCALPTLDEWLDDVATLPALTASGDSGSLGAAAVLAARTEDDDQIAGAAHRP